MPNVPVLIVRDSGKTYIHQIGNSGLTRSILFDHKKSPEWARARYGADATAAAGDHGLAGGGRGHIATLASVGRTLRPDVAKIGALGRVDFADRIAAAYRDTALAAQAREVAPDQRAAHPSNPLASLAQRLAPLTAAASADPSAFMP